MSIDILSQDPFLRKFDKTTSARLWLADPILPVMFDETRQKRVERIFRWFYNTVHGDTFDLDGAWNSIRAICDRVSKRGVWLSNQSVLIRDRVHYNMWDKKDYIAIHFTRSKGNGPRYIRMTFDVLDKSFQVPIWVEGGPLTALELVANMG